MFDVCLTVQQPENIGVVYVVDTIDEDDTIKASVLNIASVDERYMVD